MHWSKVTIPASKDSLVHLLRQFGFAEDEIQSIVVEIESDDPWFSVKSDPSLVQFLTDIVSAIHRNSWFTVEGVPEVVRTTNGVMAGNALADLLFAFIIKTILKHAR